MSISDFKLKKEHVIAVHACEIQAAQKETRLAKREIAALRDALVSYHMATIEVVNAVNDGDFEDIHKAASSLGALATSFQKLAEGTK